MRKSFPNCESSPLHVILLQDRLCLLLLIKDDEIISLHFLVIATSMARLTTYLSSSPSRQKSQASTSKAHRLEKIVDMRQNAMGVSSTIALNGNVDLEHGGKNQASRVDVAKLAKAEAKIKVCIWPLLARFIGKYV